VPFLRLTDAHAFEVEAFEEQDSREEPFSWHVLSRSIKLGLTAWLWKRIKLAKITRNLPLLGKTKVCRISRRLDRSSRAKKAGQNANTGLINWLLTNVSYINIVRAHSVKCLNCAGSKTVAIKHKSPELNCRNANQINEPLNNLGSLKFSKLHTWQSENKHARWFKSTGKKLRLKITELDGGWMRNCSEQLCTKTKEHAVQSNNVPAKERGKQKCILLEHFWTNKKPKLREIIPAVGESAAVTQHVFFPIAHKVESLSLEATQQEPVNKVQCRSDHPDLITVYLSPTFPRWK
jgi:hypothetical protein